MRVSPRIPSLTSNDLDAEGIQELLETLKRCPKFHSLTYVDQLSPLYRMRAWANTADEGPRLI